MENNILYFGYGANRDARMMKAITGTKDLKGKPAVIEGYTLVVQRLDQIPNSVAPNAPAPFSPRHNVAVNWPGSFIRHTITEDPDGKVSGTLWELTQQERDLVRDWELIDFGWYRDLTVIAETQDGQKNQVQTEGMRPEQEYDHEVDGMDYETWLSSPEEFERIATKSREEYLERFITAKGGRNLPEAK